MCITPDPFEARVHRFLETCIVGTQGYAFIIKDFNRKVAYWIIEPFGDIETEYYLTSGEMTNGQLDDYTFMQEECDRIKQEAATTRQEIMRQLNNT